MIRMKRFLMLLSVTVLVAGMSGQAKASLGLNNDPSAPDPAPVLDTGWTPDQISGSFVPSDASPYVFDLTSAAIFRITDQFIVGDTYYVYNGSVSPANLILTTTFNGAQPSVSPIGDPLGDAGWTSADYSHGQITLAAGSYSLIVEGDGVGGVPAGFYTRLDSVSAVPEPSTLAIMGLSGVMGLVYLRRGRKA